jgi:hypothetical protein
MPCPIIQSGTLFSAITILDCNQYSSQTIKNIMENNSHKGTELNNVRETWDQNERNLQRGKGASSNIQLEEAAPANELEQLIKQEASEYDNANKEDRTLGGERATVADDEA